MRKYTVKEIEAMLWIPCCHMTGMHDPCHFEEGKYICESQKAHALERFCKEISINPKVKSKPDCNWCKNPEKNIKGDGMPLLETEEQSND